MSQIQQRIAHALSGGVKLTRSQIIAATGLTVDQVRYHVRSVACPAQPNGGRGAVWSLKEHFIAPSQPAIEKITAVLDAAGSDGAYVRQIVERAQTGQSQVKIWLARGLESGLYGWHLDRSMWNAKRRRWYLAKHKPEKAPAPEVWVKKKKVRAKKGCLAPVKKLPPACAPKYVKALWQPGQEVVHMGKLTICPSGLDQRFTFTPPPGWVGEITRDWMDEKSRAS